MAISREDVMTALKDCRDPEIPVNIVDLGLIYDVEIRPEGRVHVRMTLTARGCPMHSTITECVRERVLAMEGVREATVELVWDPPWNQNMITEEGKRALGLV